MFCEVVNYAKTLTNNLSILCLPCLYDITTDRIEAAGRVLPQAGPSFNVTLMIQAVDTKGQTKDKTYLNVKNSNRSIKQLSKNSNKRIEQLSNERADIVRLVSENNVNPNVEGEGIPCIVLQTVPSNPPTPNYPASYKALTVLFVGLTGFFLILFFKFLKLTKKQDFIDDHENFPNTNFSVAQSKLISILMKCQQKIINLEETRLLLEKECSLSEATINELLETI